LRCSLAEEHVTIEPSVIMGGEQPPYKQVSTMVAPDAHASPLSAIQDALSESHSSHSRVK